MARSVIPRQVSRCAPNWTFFPCLLPDYTDACFVPRQAPNCLATATRSSRPFFLTVFLDFPSTLNVVQSKQTITGLSSVDDTANSWQKFRFSQWIESKFFPAKYLVLKKCTIIRVTVLVVKEFSLDRSKIKKLIVLLLSAASSLQNWLDADVEICISREYRFCSYDWWLVFVHVDRSSILLSPHSWCMKFQQRWWVFMTTRYRYIHIVRPLSSSSGLPVWYIHVSVQ